MRNCWKGKHEAFSGVETLERSGRGKAHESGAHRHTWMEPENSHDIKEKEYIVSKRSLV